MSEKEARTIKLRCPPLSRTLAIAAMGDQRLDLGSIARAFGLDPATLKLNGHFVSRGADLVSPSVTWRSLLSFFSSKGLPTGGDDGGGALVVDGKLLRSGSKRGHDTEGLVSRSCAGASGDEAEDCSGQSRRQSEEVPVSKSIKRSKIGDSDHRCRGFLSMGNGLGSKRKRLSEEVSLLKRLKINDASSSDMRVRI
ncbi:hypothetical protein BT93_H0550 [Corymbia citriodora subsp. variegata]|nr:hypothetical protein BT93_H0550 [Corymbia citriodora subsp. variegata]